MELLIPWGRQKTSGAPLPSGNSDRSSVSSFNTSPAFSLRISQGYFGLAHSATASTGTSFNFVSWPIKRASLLVAALGLRELLFHRFYGGIGDAELHGTLDRTGKLERG